MWCVVRCVRATPARVRTYSVVANKKTYAAPLVGRPVVAIVLDGTSQNYIDAAAEAGMMPCWTAICERYKHSNKALCTAQLPTLTLPNIAGILTGEAASVHGIVGNMHYDEATKEAAEVDGSDLKCESILATLAREGTHVTVVTGKGKACRMLASCLDPFKPSNLAFTTDPDDKEGLALASKALGGEDLYELADGFDAPGSGTFPLQVGLWLLQHRKRDAAQATQRHLYCLSTHDELQHLYGPGSPEANAFYQRFDTLLGDFDKEGAVVGVTADHGMNDKFRYDGSPRVVWADKILKDAGVEANVLLPFGDENPDHLGSCAIIHLQDPTPEKVRAALDCLREEPGVYQAFGREDARLGMQLPADRAISGDVILLADAHSVIGLSPEHHPGTTSLKHWRSHGGLEEQVVPMLFNRSLDYDHKKRLGKGKSRNYHIFEFLLNGCVESPSDPVL